jgi:hypothetical protein
MTDPELDGDVVLPSEPRAPVVPTVTIVRRRSRLLPRE